MASDSIQQMSNPGGGGVGLLGNVLTQGGIPKGGGIIRDLTKVFSKSPPYPGVRGGGESGFSLTHAKDFLPSWDRPACLSFTVWHQISAGSNFYDFCGFFRDPQKCVPTK